MLETYRQRLALKGDRESQKGFTLIELSIVLVIIGLLIGGVIKGQDLIENTKTTKFLQEIEALESALTAYNARYTGHNIYDTDDGTDWAFTNASASHTWADELGDAKLWSSDDQNPFGGAIALFDAGETVDTGETAVAPGAVCYAGVPLRAALALDGRLDDGDRTTGSIRGDHGTAAEPDDTEDVCVSHGGAF